MATPSVVWAWARCPRSCRRACERRRHLHELGVRRQRRLLGHRTGAARCGPVLLEDAHDHRVASDLLGKIGETCTVVVVGDAQRADPDAGRLGASEAVSAPGSSIGGASTCARLPVSWAVAMARISRGATGTSDCHRRASAHMTGRRVVVVERVERGLLEGAVLLVDVTRDARQRTQLERDVPFEPSGHGPRTAAEAASEPWWQ